jgi:spore maturation protein CgeB
VRVFLLGENWYGSSARACAYALRRLGISVQDIDQQTYFPHVERLSSRIIRRLASGHLQREYNEAILRETAIFQPTILLAFKAPNVYPETLRRLRERGIKLYNYYPDTSAFAHGALLPQALPEYDCIFYTKRFWDYDVRSRISLRDSVFLLHGYDPDVHHPWPLTDMDRRQFGADVVLIAIHTSYKERVLSDLIRLRPQLNLQIWGNGWRERCHSTNLARCIQGVAVLGSAYVRALRSAHICLAVMSGVAPGSSEGDRTTTRTFEIPASGGFMLHERNEEVLSLYHEGVEIECFGSVEEMADKIDFYLAHPAECDAVARAGYARCVPAYSYDERVKVIMEYSKNSTVQKITASHPM